MARRSWWKVYFFGALAFHASVIAASFILAHETQMVWWEWLFIPLYCLQLVALFGYVYNRAIVKPVNWQIVFIATVLFEVWNAYQMTTDTEFMSAYPIIAPATMVAGYLFLLPLWVGTFLFGFRCKDLWHAAP